MEFLYLNNKKKKKKKKKKRKKKKAIDNINVNKTINNNSYNS